MTATLYQGDYSDDWKYWDNTESVSVAMNQAGGSTTTVSVSDAFKGDIDRKAATYLGVEISEFDQIWTIPTALLGATNELRQTDTITDSNSVVWVIETATRVTLGTSQLFWTAATNKRK